MKTFLHNVYAGMKEYFQSKLFRTAATIIFFLLFTYISGFHPEAYTKQWFSEIISPQQQETGAGKEEQEAPQQETTAEPESETEPAEEKIYAAGPAEQNEPLSDEEINVDSLNTKIIKIGDTTGNVMSSFFRALNAIEKSEDKTVRILHYGDSLIVGDWVTQTLRAFFHQKFGNAGHGLMLIAKPWPWYRHDGIGHSYSDGWKMQVLVNQAVKDSIYGITAVSFTGSTGQWVKYKWGDLSTYKNGVLNIFYLCSPSGGEFTVYSDTKVLDQVSTECETSESKMKTILSTFDKDTVKIAVTKGTVRLFGVSFELNRPGVIYNSIGTNGLRVDHFRGMNMEQWKRQLALYNPKLVIINLGTNESGLRISMARYKDGLINLIRPVKDALPESSCLLISPIDRAQKNEIGRLDTHPMIPKLVSAQKEVAEKEGCGFINLYEAMGGRGAMARWMRSHPKLGGGDLTHPTAAGAETLARLIFNGMMSKYDEYLSGR